MFGLFPLLKERRRQLAGTLSGGEQQMLAIGRALMSTPRLLLLDEPSLGLAPILVHLIFDIIREINRQGVAILLVEQNAHQALELAGTGLRPGDRQDRGGRDLGGAEVETRASRRHTSAVPRANNPLVSPRETSDNGAMKKSMVLLLFFACLPAWSLDWKLPVFTLRYEAAEGESEDPDDETLQPSSLRNTVSLRVKEDVESASFGLTLRSSMKDYYLQAGDYSYLDLEHDGTFHLGEAWKLGYLWG